MKRFAALYAELDATNKTSAKVEAITRYLAEAPPEDAAWAVYFLSGRRIKRAVTHRNLRHAAVQASGLPMWLIDASYEQVGDLSETIALVLPPGGGEGEGSARGPTDCSPWVSGGGGVPRLHELVEGVLQRLPGMTDADREAALRRVWARLDAWQRLTFHKLISGTFRVGVANKLLVRGVADASGVDPAVMALRMSGKWEPTAAALRQLMRPADAGDDGPAAGPYPFYLASPIDGPAEVIAERLGDRGDWQAEWKWDGIRAQLIARGGEVLLWSRGDELINAAFPELVEAGRALPAGTVVDGEVLAWDTGGTPGNCRPQASGWTGSPAPFFELQKRLGRKRVEPTLFEPAVPVRFMAYDLLEHEAADLRGGPLRERRALLEAVLGGGPHARATLQVSPVVEAETWEALEAERAGARSLGVEGLMLKRLDSPYQAGRVRGHWWKWKVDPYTIDAVLMYAQRGTGERASLFSDYTFGLWSAPLSEAHGLRSIGVERELVPVAKAYSGLTREQLARMDRWVRSHTLDRRGPVHLVEPVHVFELAFESIQRSGRHRSGLAVRFPRMARWRTDKAPDEADTLDDLERLLAAHEHRGA